MAIIEIQKLNFNGTGLIYTEKGPCLIPGSLPGERVRIQSYPRKYRPMIGRILELIRPSDLRIESLCRFFPDCPGCQSRHIGIDHQMTFAVKKMRDIWNRKIGKKANMPEIHPVVPVDSDGYRIRTSLRPLAADEKLILGMKSNFPDSEPIRMSECRNHSPMLNSLVQTVEEMLNALFSVEFAVTTIRNVNCCLSTDGFHRVEIVSMGSADSGVTVQKVLRSIVTKDSLSIFHLHVASEKVSTIYKKPVRLSGNEFLTFPVGDRTYRIPTNVWTPVAYGTAECILETLARWISPETGSDLIEVGCGSGFLCIPLGSRGFRVFGIDINRWSIISARHNTPSCCKASITYQTGDGLHVLKKLSQKRFQTDIAIIHGMRRPYGSRLFDMISIMNANQIILISPSISSWIIDVKYLLANGWQTEDIEIHDQIPNTSGYLVMGCLRKQGKNG